MSNGTGLSSRSTSETMKYSEHLWQHLTPEWYSQYIQYDQMKEMLAEWVKESEQRLIVADRTLGRDQFFAEVDQEFFQVSDCPLYRSLNGLALLLVLLQRTGKDQYLLRGEACRVSLFRHGSAGVWKKKRLVCLSISEPYDGSNRSRTNWVRSKRPVALHAPCPAKWRP